MAMVSSRAEVNTPSYFITAGTLVLKLNNAAFGGNQLGFCAITDPDKNEIPTKRNRNLRLTLTKDIFFYLEK
jgi:hypothetical protein